MGTLRENKLFCHISSKHWYYYQTTRYHLPENSDLNIGVMEELITTVRLG